MTERQINLLRRGQKFTLSSNPNIMEIKTDIQEFTHKLQLIEFFHSENLDSSQETKLTFTHPII